LIHHMFQQHDTKYLKKVQIQLFDANHHQKTQR